MSLSEIMSKAKPKPNSAEVGGPTLALALHCLMVKHGFQIQGSTGRNPYSVSTDWNTKFENEWLFTYARKGYDSLFQLHCSLQSGSGKMFVQGRESEDKKNIQILGVQVENYVKQSKEKPDSWADLLQSEDTLEGMLKEHIVDKLVEHATPSSKISSFSDASYNWLQRTTEALQQRDAFVPIGVLCTTVIVAGAAVYLYRRRHAQK